jgi:hypothetical protein
MAIKSLTKANQYLESLKQFYLWLKKELKLLLSNSGVFSHVVIL